MSWNFLLHVFSFNMLLGRTAGDLSKIKGCTSQRSVAKIKKERNQAIFRTIKITFCAFLAVTLKKVLWHKFIQISKYYDNKCTVYRRFINT